MEKTPLKRQTSKNNAINVISTCYNITQSQFFLTLRFKHIINITNIFWNTTPVK